MNKRDEYAAGIKYDLWLDVTNVKNADEKAVTTNTKKSTKRAAKGYVIGRAGFAKISAVEGISIEMVDAYCQNCGYESHCGNIKYREERNWRGERIGEIEVCNRCRCV